MDDTCFKPIRRILRRWAFGLAGLLFAALTGCVSLDGLTNPHPPELPPPAPVNEVMTFWDPSLRFAQNTLNSGFMMPGLAGRVYLVNEDKKNMVDAGGSIHVAIRNTTPGAPANEPYYIVKCEFKEMDLKRLKRTDLLGSGYTLFVPWETYRPDIQQIEVQVCYVPRGGTEHYSAPTPIGLRTENRFTIDRRQQVIGAGQPQPQSLGQPQQQASFGPSPQLGGPAPVPQPQVFLTGQTPR